MISKLKYWLKPIEQIFKDFNAFVLDAENNKHHRIFIDNGGDVLFIAHLDTVLPPKYIRQRKTKSKKLKRIYAHGLDDRLGCMLAQELSQELGADLLLTDHEETFGTSAEYHRCKEYNWIAEFDRTGSDVVTYGLDNADFETALQKYWRIGTGSYSDICDLDTLACCVNVGIGYELAHSKDSYCDIKTIHKQVEMFKRFYQENKNIQYKQNIKLDIEYDGDYYESYCDLCGMIGAIEVYGYMICQDCFERIMMEKTLAMEYVPY